MRGMRDSTALRTARHLAALLFVVVLTASAAGKAGAGPWPNLLDDNRSGAYSRGRAGRRGARWRRLPATCPCARCRRAAA